MWRYAASHEPCVGDIGGYTALLWPCLSPVKRGSKETKAVTPLHHPLFAFLLSYAFSCSCKLASFWLLREELEGCSGGQSKSFWGHDSLAHRHKAWGKLWKLGKKMKCSLLRYLGKGHCKSFMYEVAHSSATILWVMSLEGLVEYFFTKLRNLKDHESVWKWLQYNTDFNIWLYRRMSVWVFFNCFFDVEPANVMFEVCFSTEELEAYFNLCEKSGV